MFRLARRVGALRADERLDWPRLLQWAHGMGGIAALRQAVLAAPAVVVPADACDALRRMGMTTSFALLYLRDRLLETVDVLGRAGVPCLPLKGAAFMLADPADAMRRPMGDIDLLVRPADASVARAALLAAGWKPSVFAEREGFYARHHHLAPLDDVRRTGLSIELHTAPLPPWHPFGLHASHLWQSARPLPGAPGVMMPAAADMLLHTCLHFTWAHMGQRGAWRLVRDVDALVADGEIEWSGFVRDASAARAATCTYWALRFASEAGGVPIPPGVLDALEPRLPPALLRRLARHFLLRSVAAAEIACPSPRVVRLLWEMMVQPVRSGHGSARPWVGDAGAFARAPEKPGEAGPAVARALSRIGATGAHVWRSFGWPSPAL